VRPRFESQSHRRSSEQHAPSDSEAHREEERLEPGFEAYRRDAARRTSG